jgi:hypothetical protein
MNLVLTALVKERSKICCVSPGMMLNLFSTFLQAWIKNVGDSQAMPEQFFHSALRLFPFQALLAVSTTS